MTEEWPEWQCRVCLRCGQVQPVWVSVLFDPRDPICAYANYPDPGQSCPRCRRPIDMVGNTVGMPWGHSDPGSCPLPPTDMEAIRCLARQAWGWMEEHDVPSRALAECLQTILKVADPAPEEELSDPRWLLLRRTLRRLENRLETASWGSAELDDPDGLWGIRETLDE